MQEADRPEYRSNFTLFLDDLLMFYQAFGVNLSSNKSGMFVAGGVFKPETMFPAQIHFEIHFSNTLLSQFPWLNTIRKCISAAWECRLWLEGSARLLGTVLLSGYIRYLVTW